jgi:ApeA-like protein/HEPN superfamily Apea-like protein
MWWRADGGEHLARLEARQQRTGVIGLEEGLPLVAGAHVQDVGRDADLPCYGTLEYAPTQAFRLPLPGGSIRVFNSSSDDYVVHGFASDGRPCSLLDCFTGPMSFNTARGFSSVEVVGHALVTGAHVVSLNEIEFQRAELALSGLREFLAEPLPTFSGERASAVTQDAATLEWAVEVAGGTLTFLLAQVRRPGHHSVTFERQALVSIELAATAGYSEWEEQWVQPLLNLLRLATREPVAVESFTAISTDGKRQAVEFIRPYADLLHAEPRHGYKRMLLSAGALGDDFAPAVARWWELDARLGRAGDLLFAMLNSRGYADAQLVTLASVAESYSRTVGDSPPLTEEEHAELVARMLGLLDEDAQRQVYAAALQFANGYPLRERLRLLVRRAGEVVDEFSRKGGRLANRIADTRNDLVHLPAQEARPLAGTELVEASALLVLVLQINLLLDFGLSRDHVRNLIAESYGQQTLWGRLRRRGHAWPKGA